MPPKPSFNPFYKGLQTPVWTKTTQPVFNDFVQATFMLNTSRTEGITRESVLSSYKDTLGKVFANDRRSQEREFKKTNDKENQAILEKMIKRAEAATAYKTNTMNAKLHTGTGQRPSRHSVGGALKLPKFNMTIEKGVTWSKYVSRLKKANPGIDITPGLADRLLQSEDNIKGMNAKYHSGGVKERIGANEIGSSVLIKRLQGMRDDREARDAYWISQGVDPELDC